MGGDWYPLSIYTGGDGYTSEEKSGTMANFTFNGVKIVFLPTGFPKKRLELLRSSVTNHGGNVVDIDVHVRGRRSHTQSCLSVPVDIRPDDSVYIIVSETLEASAVRKQLEHRGLLSPDEDVEPPIVVKATWISVCIDKRILLDHGPYRIILVSMKRKAVPSGNDARMDVSPAKVASPEKPSSSAGPAVTAKFTLDPEKFACAHSSSNARVNLNERVTFELEKMLDVYRSTKDTWRVMSYERVISLIKSLPYELTTYEEARNLRGVGESLAEKIWEIIESGKLRKAEELGSSERVRVVNLFLGVWGVGPTVAEIWYVRGWRSLDDVRAADSASSGNLLTKQQRIGLAHYDDFNLRIPRDEAAEIEAAVRLAAMDMCDQPVVVQACGSYRRKKPTCGDVDVLVTYPGLESHDAVFDPLLAMLRKSGFLTADLSLQDAGGSQRKYLGVCRLPGNDRKYRRIDIIVVPWVEYAPALMYFTGSAHFNRSMRLLAMKMGMSLSEHGLRAGVRRVKNEKVWEGQLLETPTEESIFTHLGLKYRPPEERDH